MANLIASPGETRLFFFLPISVRVLSEFVCFVLLSGRFLLGSTIYFEESCIFTSLVAHILLRAII